jgi:hypothetical protein
MKNINIKSLGLSLAVIVTFGLSGCSSSVEKSSSGGATSNDVSFPKNAVKSKATQKNAKLVKDATATNQKGGVGGLLNSVSDDSKMNTALLTNQISQNISRYIEDVNLQTYSLNAVVNNTQSCGGGGTLTISGEIIEKTGMALSMTARNCNDTIVKMNGSVDFTISGYNSDNNLFKDMSLNFTSDFEATQLATSEYAKIIKNSKFIFKSETGGYTKLRKYSLDITMLATDNNKKYGLQDCKYYFYETGENEDNEVKMYQTKGRVYINNLASYVTYDTTYDMSKTPFVFNKNGTLKNDNGEARYNMSGNGKVKIIASKEDGGVKTYIDENGDGTYELSK